MEKGKYWVGKKRDINTINKIKETKSKNPSIHRKGAKLSKQHIEKLVESHKGKQSYNRKYPDFWICENCNSEFANKTGHKRKYCSRQCMVDAQRKGVMLNWNLKRGKDNINWNGGISFEPYSIDWTKTLRRSIRERDINQCQICGKHQSEEEKLLAVHHIDYNKKNCNPENLITLCNRCHNKTNTKREKRKEFFRIKASLTYNVGL